MTPEIKEARTAADAEKQRWEEETLRKVLDKTPERKAKFEGVSLELGVPACPQQASDGSSDEHRDECAQRHPQTGIEHSVVQLFAGDG